MGDMACHMDLPFWALDLKYPKTIDPSHLEPGFRLRTEDLSVRYTLSRRKGIL